MGRNKWKSLGWALCDLVLFLTSFCLVLGIHLSPGGVQSRKVSVSGKSKKVILSYWTAETSMKAK